MCQDATCRISTSQAPLYLHEGEEPCCHVRIIPWILIGLHNRNICFKPSLISDSRPSPVFSRWDICYLPACRCPGTGVEKWIPDILRPWILILTAFPPAHLPAVYFSDRDSQHNLYKAGAFGPFYRTLSSSQNTYAAPLYRLTCDERTWHGEVECMLLRFS